MSVERRTEVLIAVAVSTVVAVGVGTGFWLLHKIFQLIL